MFDMTSGGIQICINSPIRSADEYLKDIKHMPSPGVGAERQETGSYKSVF